MFGCQNSVASGRDRALSHRSAPLWKRSPSACWICWYQAETYSKEDMRGTWYGNHCAIQKTVHGCQKRKKVGNNGLVGAASRGDECWWSHRHTIIPCNADQAVCVVHTAPYLGVGVKQAVCLVGEDLCEACKQSNKTIGSDDVTRRKWTDSMTVLDINNGGYSYSQTLNLFEPRLKRITSVFIKAYI